MGPVPRRSSWWRARECGHLAEPHFQSWPSGCREKVQYNPGSQESKERSRSIGGAKRESTVTGSRSWWRVRINEQSSAFHSHSCSQTPRPQPPRPQEWAAPLLSSPGDSAIMFSPRKRNGDFWSTNHIRLDSSPAGWLWAIQWPSHSHSHPTNKTELVTPLQELVHDEMR